MQPKRIIIVGTMALCITIGGGLISSIAIIAADPTAKLSRSTSLQATTLKPKPDGLNQLLGISSEEGIRELLYDGQSLADIAASRSVDAQAVIDLQMDELKQQLDDRLAAGSITAEQHAAYISELPDVIANSVYTRNI